MRSESRKNVKLSYLYRDRGNYKNYGSVVLSNKTHIDQACLLREISGHLTDGIYFTPSFVRLPSVYLSGFAFDPLEDHEWHELEKLEPTDELFNDPYERDISSFIEELKQSK